MSKKVITAFGVMLMIAACDPLDQYRNKSDAYLYNAAMELIEYGRYERAAKIFEEVDLQHPSSPLAAEGLLMAGYCYYLGSNPDSRNTNRFPEAIDKFESFMRLHPNHEMLPYAMYMIGICHFEMLGDEMRDQTSGSKAVDMFANLVGRFPQSIYVKDVKQKMDLILSYTAQKHIYVAEGLITEKRYAPAIDRLQQALRIDELNETSRNHATELLNICYKTLKLDHLIVKTSPTSQQ